MFGYTVRLANSIIRLLCESHCTASITEELRNATKDFASQIFMAQKNAPFYIYANSENPVTVASTKEGIETARASLLKKIHEALTLLYTGAKEDTAYTPIV